MQHAAFSGGIKNDDWISDGQLPDPEPLPDLPGYHVLVRPVSIRKETKGGVILPDIEQEGTIMGTVTATGPGLLLANGKRGPMQVKVDDIVVFPKYQAKKFEVNEEEHYIINETEVLTIVEE